MAPQTTAHGSASFFADNIDVGAVAQVSGGWGVNYYRAERPGEFEVTLTDLGDLVIIEAEIHKILGDLFADQSIIVINGLLRGTIEQVLLAPPEPPTDQPTEVPPAATTEQLFPPKFHH